jgi:acyl-coenzyme A thioesterase PaaI-like protein
MTIEPLDNDGWGFTTNCFVCEQRNQSGLRVPFLHDTERATVFGDFTLGDEFSGAPTLVHGGVSLAICDEAMAWATIAVQHKWAVTKSSTAEFQRPVFVGKPYRVEARITGGDGDALIYVEAEIVSTEREKRSVFTTAVMSVVSAVQAPSFGINLHDSHTNYLRP